MEELIFKDFILIMHKRFYFMEKQKYSWLYYADKNDKISKSKWMNLNMHKIAMEVLRRRIMSKPWKLVSRPHF